jgi:hypothetical protein
MPESLAPLFCQVGILGDVPCITGLDDGIHFLRIEICVRIRGRGSPLGWFYENDWFPSILNRGRATSMVIEPFSQTLLRAINQ